jgi:hypothetical protein
MAQQLLLLESEDELFRIDERTREIGRRGVAEVRRILAEKARLAAEQQDHSAAA